MSLEIVNNVDKILGMLNKAKANGLEAIGLAAEGHAKKECPVDTSTLRNSITHVVDEKAAYIGTNVEYAPYVELGTSKQKAQPYLKPAATEHNAEYKRLMKQSLENG